LSAIGQPSSISVVMFVRNAGATVERAMQSVFQQEGPLAELLVLDGGSTDGTLDIVKRYATQIAYWRSYPDGGPVYAINEGIRRENHPPNTE